MDLTSKRMYDLFRDQIWNDLGPLDPDWFETLTAEGLAGQTSDQDELCANQEALFKPPMENKGSCSQMCSTPKLFKHRQTSSLQPENESFSAETEMLPWTKVSPCVLQTEPSQTVNEISILPSPKRTDAALQHSPFHSNSSFVKHISERLGATVGDISWTSSLNTPPPEPPTLILSRKDCSSTVTLSEDAYVMVRKLFPLNSNASVDAIVPESTDKSTLLDLGLKPSPQAPTTVKPVPEDVDEHNEENTTICTMSSSILRKVRHERVNRRLILPTSENSCSSVVVPTNNMVKSEEKSTESVPGNSVLSQWSPLSLSEVQTHCEVNEGKQDSGPNETKDEMDISSPVSGFEAESKPFPASEQVQGCYVNSITDKSLQLSLTSYFSQVSDTALLPKSFSPAACLSAVKRAKRRAQRGSVYQHCETIYDSDSALKQSSALDSGCFSVAETALVSSTNKSVNKLYSSTTVPGLEKEDCEKGNKNNVSDISFKTASNKTIAISPVSLTKAKHFFSDIKENEVGSHSRSDTANSDVHLTVSQKAEVNELCALLEQHSASQFDFTQPTFETLNGHPQKSCPAQKSPETDFDTVKDESIVLFADGDSNGTSSDLPECDQRQNMPLKVESASEELKRPVEIGDQNGVHFEGGHLNSCEGFKSASGKVISVSDKSIQKSHDLFKDCDVAPEDGSVKCEETMVTRSKNILVNANIFRKGDVNVENGSSEHNTFKKPSFVKANVNCMGAKQNMLPPPRRGFKRTHDAQPISAAPVKRAKLLPPESEGEKNPQTPHYSRPNPNSLETQTIGETARTDETLQSGFTTAGGKHVQLSRKDFEKVKHIWKDFDVCLKTANGTAAFESTAGSKTSHAEHDSEKKPLRQEHAASRKANASSNLPNPPVTAKDSAPGISGFHSASGKALGVSAEALMKAKAMFDDLNSASEATQDLETCKIAGNKDSYSAQNIKPSKRSDSLSNTALFDLPVEHQRLKNTHKDNHSLGVGFATASGKTILVSEEAINAAKRKLAEGTEPKNEMQDISRNKTINYDGPQCIKGNSGNKSSNLVPTDELECKKKSGFITAGSKKMAASEEALIIAKRTLTEEIEPQKESSSLCPEPSPGVMGHSVPNISKTCSVGFTTASGKKVTIPEEAINKAKKFLTEKIEKDSVNVSKMNKDGSSSPPVCSVSELNGTCSNVSRTNGFSTASGKKVTVSEEALNKAMIFLTDKMDQTGHVMKKNKDDSSLINVESSDISCAEKRGGGFTTASGKKVTISEDALNKAKNLLKVDVDQDTTSNISSIKNSKSGFSTASGKKVPVSEEALNKAVNFLSEKRDQDKDAPVHVAKKNKDSLTLPLRQLATNLNSTSLDLSSAKKQCGFSTASGKKVTVSEEALSKAMNLLVEKTDADVHVKTKNKDGSSLPTGRSITNVNNIYSSISCVKNARCGFTTASGNEVTVSEEALNKAKHFLTEKNEQDSDGNAHVATTNKDSLSLPLGQSCTNLNNTSLHISNNSNGFSTASGKKVSVCEEALSKAINVLSENLDQNDKSARSANNISNLKPPVKMEEMKVPPVPVNVQKDTVQCVEYNRCINPDQRSPQHCSMVNLDAPNLRDCSTTQQRFLAQEALDCTRALLEDEGRAALEDVTAQPGLGNKSPEECDVTLDRRKESVLNPMKSCLNGLSKDRRVFQYHVPLHPNITKSHKFGKDNVNIQKLTSAARSTAGQSDLKAPLFVPPFQTTRGKSPKNDRGAQKDKEKVCTFVPPFKKLKHDSNSIQMQQKDLSVTKESCESGTFIPPTRKNQNPGNDAFPDQTNERSPRYEVASDTEAAPDASDHMEAKQNANGKEQMKPEEMQQEILLNVENLDLARDLQDMRIRKKSRQTIRPIPGSLFLSKSSQKRQSFRVVVNGQTPQKYSQKQLYACGVDQALCHVTSETAEEFRFKILKFYRQQSFSEAGGVQLADGGWLVPKRDGTVGKEEFYRALCDTPGVDPKLLSQRWVSNHYRWVVWKLACMERSFPASMASACLTLEQVLLQLKYRYDVEVDHSRRPCLRKIIERDDTCAKTLVLCVCGIVSAPQDAQVKPESPGAVVWLTDGWYAIKAQLDEPLTALLHRGAITEGVKLMCHGAQLVGSQDACSPLEAPDTLLLKIFTNSTRRVRWDTKLGFYKDPRPFMLPLSSIFSAGGVVCSVDMLILRVYPIQWMERKPDGGVVFRSERAEEKEARRYNNSKQKTMETIYAKIKAEFENEEKERMKSQVRRRTVRREDLCRCQDGEELFEAVGDEADLEAYLTLEQLQSLKGYRRSLLDQRQAVLQERLRRAVEEAEASEGSCPKRDMATVWRLSIADSRDQAGSAVYQLSIWNPSSDLQAVLKEGTRHEVSNLAVSEGRTRGGKATIQLTSTRKTHFRNLQPSPQCLLSRFRPRVSVPFAELQKPGFVPLCGEVDLAGCVIHLIDQHGPSPTFYLVDECLNFVKVHSLVSFARCGWEELLEHRALVCLSNLQVRAGCAGPTPVLYAGDMSSLSTQPRESHLRQALAQLQQAIQDQDEFFVRAENRFFETVSMTLSAVNPRTPQSTKMGHDLRASVKRQTADSTPPVRTPGPPNSLTKKDPRNLKRRRALDYLCHFPPPPPLSHLSSAVSPSVKKTFLPPRRSSLTPSLASGTAAPGTARPQATSEEAGWVHDDELALIDTQELRAADALLD